MGVWFSTHNLVDSVSSYVRGRKRKYTDSDEDEVNKVIDLALHTPKRKKLVSTTEYIYRALFEEGKNSDVTVCALDEEFNLHKIYLCQSPYFASMFGGSWLETTKKYISIDIIDPLITLDSLRTVFGSLYNSEIVLNPLEIVPILATATMFQLDGLIEKCTEVMLETINPKTSLEYYNAACCYGDKKLQEVCFQWFLVNLMTYYFTTPILHLKSIPVGLMTKLVTHPDLFVMQTEYSMYVMLKYWMYMIVHNVEEEPVTKEINNFYCARREDIPYLLTEEGRKFLPVFQGLRLNNLVSHQMDVELVLRDNIIPKSWLNPVVLEQWKHVLMINQNEDKGPSDVSDEVFLATSLRCGRTLPQNERNIWRWTGFHFGVDLLMLTNGPTVSIRRNHRSESEQLLCLQNNRHIAIRITVVKLNEQRQIVYSKRSEIQRLCLAKGEEVQIMTLDKELTYPIIISACILFTSPHNPQATQQEVIQTVS